MPILLVDDNPVTVSAVEAWLRRRGYEVRGACNGESALKRLALQPYPSVAVVDQIMEGMSGTDLITIMRRDPNWKGIPAVVVTAMPDGRGLDELKGELAALGNCRLLRKPFEPEALPAAIEEAVRACKEQRGAPAP